MEKKVAEEGLILTERQIAALEKKKEEDVACGEIETAHPGYLWQSGYILCGNN